MVMEGKEFHISLRTDARPFCVNTPRSIPLAYRDKLKSELDLLLTQNNITPVTEATVWCAPIVVTPKKNTDRIRMCPHQQICDAGALPITNTSPGSRRHCRMRC